ncbi:mucin-19-like isoform X4 [Dermacentor albipictus]|uniref:mucin-19-like isoform X4 n=1 Tax=Dermacentor albipictus TaxID=60249 RepID=UPI0038FC2F51
MNIFSPLLFLYLILVCQAWKPKEHDDRCQITAQTSKNKCSHQRWYLDQKTKRCLQSCDPAAPFSNKIQCEGVCRNGKVCDYPMASVICFGKVFPVYIYNPNKGRCFFAYDCSYFGNKFPTLGECQRTCEKRTGSRPLPGLTGKLVPQVTLQSTIAAGSGLVAQQTGIAAGEQQSEGTTATGTHVAGSAASFSPSAGVGQATTLPSQSSLATDSGVTQTTNAVQGSSIPAMSSSQVSSQTNIVNASPPDQLPLLPPKNPPIVQVTMQQLAPEQQEVKFAPGSDQEACTPPCMFNISVPQQGNLQPNFTAVKLHEKPKPPRTDKRCKVIATIPTYKCRERWFFNKKTGACLPSCSRRAPFRNKIACDGVCRSAEACNFPMASIPCFLQVHEVFIYNSNQNSCFKAYDCSYFGNKFPTMQECQRTCRKGGSRQHLAGTATGTSLTSKQMPNIGSNVGLQPASSNSAASLGAGLRGNGIGSGGSQHQLAGSATGASLPSTQMQNTGSNVGHQPASSNSAVSLGAAIPGNGIGTGGSQQQLAGSATGPSLPSTQMQNTGSNVGHQPASSNSASSLGAGVPGNGIGTGGSQQQLAGSATGPSLPSTQMQNTGSNVGHQPASSSSASSLGTGLPGNGIGTDGTQQQFAGSATGTSLPPTQMQNTGSNVGHQPASSNSASSLGAGVPGNGLGTGGSQQQFAGSATGTSLPLTQMQNTGSNVGHQPASSNSVSSLEAGVPGNGLGRGGSQQQLAGSATGPSLSSTQMQNTRSTVGHKPASSNSAASLRAGLPGNGIGTGGSQLQLAGSTAGPSLPSTQMQNCGSTVGHQPVSSNSAASLGAGLSGTGIGTSGSQQQLAGATTGPSLPSTQMQNTGSTVGHHPASSNSAASLGAGLPVNGMGTGGSQQQFAGSATGSSLPSTQMQNNGSTVGLQAASSNSAASLVAGLPGNGTGTGAGQDGPRNPILTGSEATGEGTSFNASAGQQAGPSVPVKPNDQGLVMPTPGLDDRCQITAQTSKNKCSHHRWYLDQKTKRCLQSCDPAAPFSNKIQCEGVCRNGKVCDYPMASVICFGKVFPVYIYNPNKGRCFFAYDCSYFGNKFPTLGECQRTCEKRTGSRPLPGLTGKLVPQVTLQSTIAAGSGLVAQQTGIAAGEQQSEGTTATGTHVAGSAASFSPSAGVGQATTLPSQSSLATDSGVTQTTNAVQGSTIPAMSSSQVSSQTNIVNASPPDQLPLLPPKNPPIVQVTMQQLAPEQQEVKFAPGSDQEACTPPCMFNISVPQQGNLQPNFTAVKIHEKPKPPRTDKRCKVIATIPTYKCRERWFFNKKTGACLPSCSRRAPFRNKIACDGVCRSAEACNFPMASIPCFLQVHEVFIYNSNQNSCFKAYDCSYFGNKFPTMQECQRTCRKGGSRQHLAGTATGTSLTSTQMPNIGSNVGLQPASSNSAASLGAGLRGNGIGSGGSQHQLAGSATGPSLPSTQMQNTGSNVGHQPASSNSAVSLGAAIPGNGIGTGGSQQQLAGSATGPSLPSTQMQNTGSNVGHQPASSSSASSLGTGLPGNGIRTGGSQQQFAGSATGTSLPPTQMQNTGSNVGHQPASSNSASSPEAGVPGNGLGRGGSQQQLAGSATGPSLSSTQMQNTRSTVGHQPASSNSAASLRAGLPGNGIGTGGSQLQLAGSTAGPSLPSTQMQNTGSTVDHQPVSSNSAASLGAGLSGTGIGTSGSQQQLAGSTTGPSLPSTQMQNSGSTVGHQPASSNSAASLGAGLPVNGMGTGGSQQQFAGSATGSSLPSTQMQNNGSTVGLQAASSNSAASLVAGLPGNGTGTGGSQQQLAGSATGPSLPSTQMQNTGSNVGHQPASSSSASSLGTGLPGNGIGTGGTQQQFAGSATGTSLPPTQMQNTGSNVGHQPASSNSASSLGAGVPGNGLGTDGSQQQFAGSATGTSLPPTQMQNTGSNVGHQPASSNSASSLEAGVPGNGLGRGGSQQQLAGSAKGPSPSSTQMQNTRSTVGHQPASSNSAASLRAGLPGNGIGTGGSQLQLAGSTAGPSLPSTQMQNTGSTVDHQPVSSNSAASLGAGLSGTGIGTSGSQQQLAGSTTGPSLPSTQMQNSGSTVGHQPASSNSAASLGAGLPVNGMGTGGSQQQFAGSATGSSLPSTQMQNNGSTVGLQAASSNSAASLVAGLPGNGTGTGAGQDGPRNPILTGSEATGEGASFNASAGQQAGPSVPVKPNDQGLLMPTPGLGGAQQQVGNDNASTSQLYGQTSSSDITASHQASPSLSGMSTGSSLGGHQPPTGAAQQQIPNVTTSSTLASGPAQNSGSSAGVLPAPSLSATSMGTSMVEHQLGTAQVSTSSSSNSAHVEGSTAGLLTQQVGVTGAGVLAEQPTIGSTHESANHAGSSIHGSGLPNNSNAPGIQKPGSSEPMKPSGPGYGAPQQGQGQNESTGSEASGQTITVTQQHSHSDKKLSLKDAYDHRCKNAYGWPSGNCTTERWYYNRRTRECRPSCDPAAPFLAKIDCDGICRSAEACDFPMASIFCVRPRHVIYIYNPNKRRCFQAHDCSYYGNKFPTLRECRRTCIKGSTQTPLPSSTGSISQSSGQVSTSDSRRGQQSALSPSASSTGAGLLANAQATGSAQKPLASSTGSISQSSGQASISDSHRGQHSAPSQSGTSTGAGLLPNVQGTGLPKPVPASAKNTTSHHASQNLKASAVNSYGISSEDKATVNVKSIKK